MNRKRWDYVSPGMEPICPDDTFPDMIEGDPARSAQTLQVASIPHRWYVDRLDPTVGLLTRDEASILYNSALRFSGGHGLGLGNGTGWWGAHLVRAGVSLDLVDPILGISSRGKSIAWSLTRAAKLRGGPWRTRLIPEARLQKVVTVATESNSKWSFLFVDGFFDEDTPARQIDVLVKYCSRDAMILIHDLGNPGVAGALYRLRELGWATMIYDTMHLMGVAWRGNVAPIMHQSDPAIRRVLPGTLQGFPRPGDFGPVDLEEFRGLAVQVRDNTVLSDARLLSLYRQTKSVCLRDSPGAIVECGSFRGGAIVMMAIVSRKYSRRPRLLYAFDTFEGMPDPTDLDQHRGIHANSTPHGSGALCAPLEEFLLKSIEEHELNDFLHPVKGLFADTLPMMRCEIGEIAILHADGDWYQSTLDIFQNLYDLVRPGGVIQVDDYGHWAGCKAAVEKFQKDRGINFVLHGIDYTGVWMEKPT